MPFKSKKQQRYAFATKQPWAEEFAQETKKIKRGKKKGFKALPEQVEKNAFGVVHKSFVNGQWVKAAKLTSAQKDVIRTRHIDRVTGRRGRLSTYGPYNDWQVNRAAMRAQNLKNRASIKATFEANSDPSKYINSKKFLRRLQINAEVEGRVKRSAERAKLREYNREKRRAVKKSDIVHKRLMPLNPHQTAVKVAMKQARTGKMKVSDAQASADWAAKQMQRAGIKKSDISKSTRQERAQRRALTGVGVGAATGGAAIGGLYTRNNYSMYKQRLKGAWDRHERLKEADIDRENARRQFEWRLSGGQRSHRVWVPGSTGEKFESPKQAERVRRLRNLANHESSINTPEGQQAASRLKNMGFDPKPQKETPGGYQTRWETIPKPENIRYERKPWTSPGTKTLLRNSTKLRGFKSNLAGAVATGAVIGAYGGIIGGVKYHQKREGLGPYGKKKR